MAISCSRRASTRATNPRKWAALSGILGKVALTFLALTVCFSAPAVAQKKPKLEKTFSDWLNRDVVYIITKDERDDFLKLTTDEARDKFIEQFWEIRNPDPGSPTNSYKDDIYKRIAFTNARFGIGSGSDGWRTDRGRTYITLGEPQQKQVFRNSGNMYPIEIWFYGNVNPALPRAFYVMFYQREGSGDYRYYSPYVDGPDKLVTGVEGINNNAAALKMIGDSVGPEVARISLSLLPDEPVDPTGSPSLESDLLLAQIKGLANLPATRADITRRRSMRESVTSRLLLEGTNLEIVTFPMHDSHGLSRLDYAIRMHNPADLSLTDLNDGNYRYSVEVRIIVFAADTSKAIFTQQKTITDTIDKKSLDHFREKVFGYQGTLPLPPGKYRLDIQLTDWSKKNAYHTVRDVAVPAPSKDALVIPAILPFTSAEQIDPGLSDVIPFASAGVKFNPTRSPSPLIAPGTSLQVMYQIWAPPPANPKTYAGQKLAIEYALGRPAARGDVTKVNDVVDMEQFDSTGNLVTGKKLALERNGTGNYVLALTVTKEGTNERYFAGSNFRVADTDLPTDPYDVLEPGLAQDAETGVLDQNRGLCYLAFNQPVDARVWFRRSLQLNHGNDVARAHLVDAYFSIKDYRAVVAMYNDAGITDSTDSITVARIATSVRETGKPDIAISLLESALRARPNDGPLYLALAGYYGQMGNAEKAAELNRKGKSLMTPEAQTPHN
jgi:GWxTD domain-containing protein